MNETVISQMRQRLEILYQTMGGGAGYSSIEEAALEGLKASKWGPYDFYVDPVNGNDINIGSQVNPFKTLRQAIREALKYKSAIIYLAEGTYEESESAIELRGGSSISIRGANANVINTTIIKSRFNIDRGAYLCLKNLTIDSTEIGTSTSNGTIYAFEHGDVYLDSCNIIAAQGPMIRTSTGGEVFAMNCTLTGTPSNYCAQASNGSEIQVRVCTNRTGKPVRADLMGTVKMGGCTGFTVSQATYGMVYVDGKQTLPE